MGACHVAMCRVTGLSEPFNKVNHQGHECLLPLLQSILPDPATSAMHSIQSITHGDDGCMHAKASLACPPRMYGVQKSVSAGYYCVYTIGHIRPALESTKQKREPHEETRLGRTVCCWPARVAQLHAGRPAGPEHSNCRAVRAGPRCPTRPPAESVTRKIQVDRGETVANWPPSGTDSPFPELLQTFHVHGLPAPRLNAACSRRHGSAVGRSSCRSVPSLYRTVLHCTWKALAAHYDAMCTAQDSVLAVKYLNG